MIKARYQWLIGDPKEFSLQSRMFHAVSIFISITLFGKALFYCFTSLQLAAVVCALAGLLELGFYYLSRFKLKVQLAIKLSSVKLTFIMILIYQYNAGLNGNMLLLSAISLFLIILIIPTKQGLIWLMINMLIVFTMMVLEYFNPQIVQQQYQSRKEQFFDLGATYLTVAILLYAGITILRKSYEAQKRLAENQANKLLVTNQEKDKLFSIISSELSAPIASVKHYLDLIQAEGVDSKERTVIEQDLTRSLGDAKILLNNLLHWSKSQMELNYVQLEGVKLEELIRETIELFQQRADKKGISIDLKIENKINVFADPNMLKVVMRNLLNNAIKFSHLKGAVELSAHSEGSKCVISVKDYGVGLTAEKQQRIFTLNVTSSYGTANEKGTGLGLILCRDFILQQGGEIWFKSIPWEGTTFYVSLPMAI